MLVSSVIGNKDEFNTYDIGFIISPRLNASGRMNNADSSLKLLLENQNIDEGIFKIEISSIIDELEKSNSGRKDVQQKTVKEILDNNDFYRIASKEKIFIAKSDTWSAGVLGIVASEIVKKHNIPVILFVEAEGILKGSGRSIEKFDLYNNLGSLSHYFKKYGGHKQACGITMELKNFEDFKSSMIELANKILTEKDLEKVYYFDAEIDFSEINFKLASDIGRLEPFGVGNIKPVFQTQCCQINGEPRLLKDGKHMVLKLKNSNKEFEAIIFNCSDLYPDFTNYIIENRKDKTLIALLQLDILYSIELKKSPYDENKIIQLCIQSIKIEPGFVKPAVPTE
jgi:single-stranded-DNA-specific exonuclease